MVHKMKHNRIRLKTGLVYCTSIITSQVLDLTIRLNQVLHPRKGNNDALHSRLCDLAMQYPDDFTEASRLLLRPYRYQDYQVHGLITR